MGGKSGGVSVLPLPPGAPEAFGELPPAVRGNPQLVSALAELVASYLTRESPPEGMVSLWAPDPVPCSRRELRGIITAIDRLASALDGLDPRSREWVIETWGPRWDTLKKDLRSVRFGASTALRYLGPTRPGPREDVARHQLEHEAADLLQAFGVRLTKSRYGALARTLVAVYEGAGLPAPSYDSLFPVVKRRVDWIPERDALVAAIRRRLAAKQPPNDR